MDILKRRKAPATRLKMEYMSDLLDDFMGGAEHMGVAFFWGPEKKLAVKVEVDWLANEKAPAVYLEVGAGVEVRGWKKAG